MLFDWFRSYLTNRTQFALIEGKNHNLANTTVVCLKALSLDPYYTYFIQRHWLTFCVIIRCNLISSLMILNYTSLFHQKQRPRISLTIAKIQDCLSELDRWMSLYSKHRSITSLPPLRFGKDTIHPSYSARTIGVIFDSTMSVLPYVNSVCILQA